MTDFVTDLSIHGIEIATANLDTALADATTLTATKMVRTPTPTGASRSLNSAFQIDPTYPTLVFYTIQLSVTAPLLSSQDITVTLYHDASNPPTTQSGQIYLQSAQLAGLSLVSMQTTQQQVLVDWIPAGDYVKLTTSGAGSATLLSVTELVYRG